MNELHHGFSWLFPREKSAEETFCLEIFNPPKWRQKKKHIPMA
jgi:hypothetical protein